MKVLYLLSISVSLFGQTILSVNGTYSNGDTIVINGTSLGLKSPAAPWLWDSFENYSVGIGLDDKSPQIGTTIYERYNYEGNEARYDDERAHSGNQSAKTVNNSSGSTTRDHFAFAGQAAQKRYISYWVFQESSVSGVFKGDRQTANLGNGNGNRLYDSPPNFGRDNYIFTNNCDDFTNHGYIGYGNTGIWHRVEQWIIISDADVANGRYDYIVDLELDKSTGDYATLTSSCSKGGQIDSWISPNYVNLTGSTNWWVDDLYVDSTLARIEIGDNQEFDSCTHREIQIPTFWSQSNIQIIFNQGTFKSGEQAYLFVVDNTGEASNGFPIIIGAPKPPVIKDIKP